jgi:outer membrane usher protein
MFLRDTGVVTEEVGDAGITYQGTYGNASLGYGYSRNYRQVRYAMSGSAVLHEDGLTLGQPLGHTNVLISAPGAVSVPVENGTGVRTDWRGYTIMPYASMYRENRIALDISKLDDHTDIDNAVSRIVPTRGPWCADFKTSFGIRALVTVLHNGKLCRLGPLSPPTMEPVVALSEKAVRFTLRVSPHKGSYSPLGKVVTSTAP